MLRLKSLGQTLIEIDDARLTPAAETLFATALYLIVEAGRRVEREELLRMLWPGVSEAQAQHGLRQVLYKLKSLGATIKADRSALILAPRFCATDFASLLAPNSSPTLEELADGIGGSFLPGYRPQFAEEFETWVERQRDIVHSAVARALIAGIHAKKRGSDWSGAEKLAAMCLAIDPLNEEATLTFAEAAALGGSKTKALSILNHYLKDIGDDAGEIKLPAVLLRRRISEAYLENIVTVRDAPFVGREQEMGELTRALARAQSGQGSAFVISGAPGIGKTRLLAEFTRVASLQRLRVVRVACQSHDVRRPLSAFVEIIPKLLSLPGALGCSPASMTYLRRLTAHDPEQARLREEQEQTDISYDIACDALLDVLGAIVAESCCLIELEDAQWLDPLSTQVVEAVSSWLPSHRLLFVLTSRHAFQKGDHLFNLALRPLTADASSVVANALVIGDRERGEHFRSWCVSSSGGNPYYLIELLRNGALAEEGYRAPTSLSRLLQTRVSNLSPFARNLLEVCCVLGTHSTLYRLEKCIELPRAATLTALNELDAAGMISMDGPAVVSRHDLLSSAVLAQMSPAVKLMVHRYVASQLESEADSSHSSSLIWESAEHWLMAQDTPRAIQLLRRCGNYLVDVGMPDEAARVLERAESLAMTPNERYEVGTERVRALMRAEQSEEAFSVLETLLLTRNLIHPQPSPLDEVVVMSLQVRWEIGQSIPQLVDDCLLALSSVGASSQECITAARWLLSAADNMCDCDLARRIYDLVAHHINSPNVATETRLWFEMIFRCCVGDGEVACAAADELVEYSLLKCPPLVRIRYLRHSSHVHALYGRVERALSLGLMAFQIAESLETTRVKVLSASHMSSIFLHAGDLCEAKNWLDRAVNASAPGSLTVLDVNLRSYRAELALRQGDVLEAEESIEICIDAGERAQSPRSGARGMALNTQLCLLKNSPLNREKLEDFLALFIKIQATTGQDYNAESLFKGLISVGRAHEARILANGFISQHRIERSLPSPFLSTVLNDLGIVHY